MSLKLSELIAAYGDDKVQFQNLDQCIDTIDYHHKKGTTIKFGTDVQISRKAGDGLEKLGLVVWFDRQAVADIIASSKPPVSTPIADGESE